ncbi:ABC transporter substrate-binding protein [Azospirillum doebereinerae]|uniref:ABC transporter substrate-binding protein n=1 Tax=Azospirillum doebereinerae TaxID=92933 RepID=A0A433J8B1_9PROT|nr:ABC transporter substrate-binding protein [Azospirillum doebereinerae]MCG5241710.1 ABC transporter substrate-binding protein [Azospirillum doebereinerae]RUQ70203.1 ABC transporter substrate-binding protein [Azospirillum doebereinerae]
MYSLTRRAAIAAMAAFVSVATLAPGASRAADPVKLEIGYIPILAAAPLFIIDGQGWAKDAGITLKLTRFESGPHAIQAMAAGQIDLLYAGVAPVLVARTKGVDVSVIANSAVEEMVVAARGPFAKAVGTTPTADTFKKFAADNGRKAKIGTQPPGSVPDTVLKHWLFKVVKVNPADVELVPMGIEKTQQALLAGALDAATIREPTVTVTQQMDPSVALLATGAQMFPDQPGTVVSARGEVLKKNPEAIGALIKAHLRAVELIAKDPAGASKIVNEYLGKGLLEPSTLEAAFRGPGSKFVADPHGVVPAVENMMNYAKEIGSADGVIPVAEAFDFRFYDAAVAK